MLPLQRTRDLSTTLPEIRSLFAKHIKVSRHSYQLIPLLSKHQTKNCDTMPRHHALFPKLWGILQDTLPHKPMLPKLGSSGLWLLYPRR